MYEGHAGTLVDGADASGAEPSDVGALAVFSQNNRRLAEVKETTDPQTHSGDHFNRVDP